MDALKTFEVVVVETVERRFKVTEVSERAAIKFIEDNIVTHFDALLGLQIDYSVTDRTVVEDAE